MTWSWASFWIGVAAWPVGGMVLLFGGYWSTEAMRRVRAWWERRRIIERLLLPVGMSPEARTLLEQDRKRGWG